MQMLKNKNVLITGGTGSFGRLLVHHLVQNQECNSITVLSRDEHKQFKMRLNYPENQYPRLKFLIGDIRDFNRVNEVCKNIHVIFHLAALKHVHIAEQNPLECIKTNILGSENVIRAALNNNVEKVIALSSDKAASPHNLYGATKFCADKLFVNAQHESDKTIFSVVRLGNVVNSRGSVFEIFEENKKNGVVYVSDPNATRFIITAEKGIKWLLFALNDSKGGEIYIPKIKSFKVSHLAKVIAPKAKIRIVGLKFGEKLHEHLITETDSNTGVEFSNYYVIYNNLKSLKQSKGTKLPSNFTYISSKKENLMTIKELKEIVKSQKFVFEI
jgi:FlaA1/EpsC-like NDP-sugar epimerase